MTHRARDAAGGVPRIWILPAGILAGVLAATAAGVLSESLILDLMAWWPVWLLLAALVLVAVGRRLGRVRASGLVPLAATGALVAFLLGHLAGWDAMPSASQALVGPTVDPETSATLSASIDGEIRVAPGSKFLYKVDPIRWGGEIGLPVATEQIQGSSIAVLLEPPPDPGLMTFSGWDVALSSSSAWALSLRGEVEADLTGLHIVELQLEGIGSVTLAQVDVLTPASVLGTYELVVPDGVPARVVGDAAVPSTWQQADDGWEGPASGEGWVISVDGDGSLTVTNG